MMQLKTLIGSLLAVVSLVVVQSVGAASAGGNGANISSDAQKSLTQAEDETKAAEASDNMWTVTDEALKKAETAAKQGNSDDVIKYSKMANEYARQSIEQTRYPLVH